MALADEDIITVVGPDGQPMRIARSAVDPAKYQSAVVPSGNKYEQAGIDINSEMNAAAGPGEMGRFITAPANMAMGTQDPTMAMNQAALDKEMAAEAALKQGIPIGGVEGSQMQPPQPMPVAVPEAMGPIMAGNLKRAQAADQIANIAGKVGTFKANEQAAYNKTMEENMAKQAEEAKARQDIYKGMQMAVDENAKQIAANPPKDFWAEKSTASKILAALSVGVGAYASTTGGGPNFAMKIIDDAIQRDANLQEAKRRGLKEAGAQKLSGYQTQLAALGDASAARDADIANKYKYMIGRVTQFENSLKGPEAKAQAMDMRGQLEAQYGKYLASAAEKAAKAKGDKSENFIPSLGVYAYSKKAAETYNDLAIATGVATDGIQELLTISNKKGKEISPELRAQAQTTASLLRAALRVPILGQGAVSDTERALMEKIVADPTAVFSLDSTNKKSLQTLAERLTTTLKINQKYLGLSGEGPMQNISSFKAD